MKGIDYIKILKRGSFYSDPFPHWIINDFFSFELAEKINSCFPSSNQIHKLNLDEAEYTQNTAYSIESSDIDNQFLEFKNIFDAWPSEKEDIIDFISDYFPNKLKDKLDKIKNFSYTRGDIRATSPTKKINTTQLGPHCDNPN